MATNMMWPVLTEIAGYRSKSYGNILLGASGDCVARTP